MNSVHWSCALKLCNLGQEGTFRTATSIPYLFRNILEKNELENVFMSVLRSLHKSKNDEKLSK